MKVGGAARYLVEARHDEQVIDALRWANERGLSVRVLGGGSNVVVSDAGMDGLVIAMLTRGVSSVDHPDAPLVVARAGESWDALVAHTVSLNLQGLECLSGIPGLVGATPIQNVGAYGQEVAQTIESVRVVDRETSSTASSAWKSAPSRIGTAVSSATPSDTSCSRCVTGSGAAALPA